MRLADAFGRAEAPGLSAATVALVTGAPERLRTLRGTIRDWANHRLVAASLGREPAPGLPESEAAVWRVWFEFPTSPFDDLETPRRVRVEKVLGGVLRFRAVRDDERWWAWTPDEGPAADRGRAGGPYDLWLHLLAPTWTFSETVEERGSREWLGREAIELHDPAGTGFLGPKADAASYYVDAERGVLLRAEAEVEGAPAAVEEFIDIAFDEELDPTLFSGSATRRTVRARRRRTRTGGR